MIRWRIVYYPPSGTRNSPADYIDSIDDIREAARVAQRIEQASQLQLGDWPKGWRCHQMKGKVWQFDAGGQHRIAYCIDDDSLIILHIFKKQGRKTRKEDLALAQSHYVSYIEEKGK